LRGGSRQSRNRLVIHKADSVARVCGSCLPSCFLIKPNRAILCLDAMHSHPPSCSNIQTSPILLRQTPACRADLSRRILAKAEATRRRVKAGQSQSKCFRFVIFGPRFQPLSRYIVVPPAKCTSNGGCLLRWTLLCSQSAIRNPQSAIPPGSTWFHLIPLVSTSSTRGLHAHAPAPPPPIFLAPSPRFFEYQPSVQSVCTRHLC
jgi:hypothetical protein